MPLNPSGLQSDLQDAFENPGATAAAAAQLWSSAVQAYAAGVVPASTTVSAAGSALLGAVTAAFGNIAAPPTAAAMEIAFLTFAASVGVGMAPAFVAVPPPGPVGFATLFAQPFPSTHAAAAANIASAIDAWMHTGTATPSVGGSPAPWA